MSLEIHLARNNELVALQNDLLTQLLQALSTGAALSTKNEQVLQAAENADESGAVDIGSLSLDAVVAIAGFYPNAQDVTAEQVAKATAYQSAIGDDRNEQIDALRMALSAPSERHLMMPKVDNKPERKGPFFWKHPESDSFGTVSTVEELGTVLADQAVEINKAEYLQLKEAAEETSSQQPHGTEQPDFAGLRKQAEGLILQLAKAGYREEAVSILDKVGAKKLGQVTDDNLAEVVALAEKALEG